MDRSAAHIPAEALTLPSDARAKLATRCIDSLDDAVDDDAEASWSAEIARRIHDIDAGRTELVPWTEARRRRLK